MAVYTDLDGRQLADLVAAYDVGTLISATGIAEGVSNSNWLIETTGRQGEGARFVLTMYERRIEIADLPFFLGLLDHLAAKGCPVPATVHDREGAPWRETDGKAVALIEHMPGAWPHSPDPAQAHAVGAALALVHRAAGDFPGARANPLGPVENAAILAACGAQRLAAIDRELPEMIAAAERIAARWPSALPESIIHSDLFPDNVLMQGDRVTGLIDFYFACTGFMAYDLAATHAAWSFDSCGERFDPALGAALVAGYESVRPLEARERAALPLLAEGACLRFVASRAQDRLELPAGTLAPRKDPMDFVRRRRFYAEQGEKAFAPV